jgi:hypothetical protein
MIKSYSLIILSSLILLASCQKSSDEFVPNPGQQLDTLWSNTISETSQVGILTRDLAGEAFTAKVDLSKDTVLRTSNGLVIEIPKGSLQLSNGTVYSDSAFVQYQIVQNYGGYIRFAVHSVSNLYPLETRGNVLIQFGNSATYLKVVAGKRISVKYTSEFGVLSNAGLYGFTDYPSLSSSVNWTTVTDAHSLSTWTSTNPVQQSGYLISTTRLGWLQIARPLASVTYTPVRVVMSDLFSNTNTKVFIVGKSFRTVVQLSGNVSERNFSFPNIPVNAEVKFITVSKIGNTYYLGVKDDKITSNHSIFIRPELSDINKIRQFLNSL